MTLKQLKFKLKHLNYFIGYYLNLEKYRGSGLDKKIDDPRDYTHADMFVGSWLFGYTPEKTRRCLPGISDAWNQGSTMCCQWFATAKAKEIYEKCRLSVKSLISWGRRNGLCGDQGLSAMESGEKGLKNWGIMEESEMPSEPNTYNNLSSGNIATEDAAVKANKHKSSAYVRLNSIEEIYKMIDEGRPVKIGIDWYSAFNRSGGHKDYWLIDDIVGYYGGGHCLYIPAYDQSFRGLRVFPFQNSYGADWGITYGDDDGNFFNGAGVITEQMLLKLGKKYGFYVNFDVETDLDLTAEQIIEKFDGMNVRGNKNGAIYRIIGGAFKASYISDKAFLSINGFPYTKPGAFTIVNQEELDKIPVIGDGILTGDLGQFKTLVDGLKEPVNNNFKY